MGLESYSGSTTAWCVQLSQIYSWRPQQSYCPKMHFSLSHNSYLVHPCLHSCLHSWRPLLLEMRDGISGGQLAQAVAAFAILSVFYYALIIYTYKKERRVLLPPFTWAMLVAVWIAFLVSGITLTIFIVAAAGELNHPDPDAQHLRQFFGLKGIASLSLEVILVNRLLESSLKTADLYYRPL